MIPGIGECSTQIKVVNFIDCKLRLEGGACSGAGGGGTGVASITISKEDFL